MLPNEEYAWFGNETHHRLNYSQPEPYILNTNLLRLTGLLFLLNFGTGKAFAQGVYSTNIFGYYNYAFMAGSNLFNNGLQQTYSNALSEIFSWPTQQPDGTTVSLWNPATLTFDSTSTFSNGVWSIDLILPPGTGALVFAPAPFTATINGYVLDHDGNTLTSDNTTLPPLYTGPNGIYLLGDKCPVVDIGTNIFLNILGRLPYIGEQVIQFSDTSTYLGNGMWDSIPTLGLGDAAFLNIISEPAPSLTIIYTNHQAIVSWPSSVLGWTLQTNNNLSTGTWGNYGGSVINNTVTNSTPAGNVFFRLSYQ